MSTKIVSHNEQINDPLMLKAYAEALEHKQRWQASIDQLIRAVLGLKGDQPLDPATVPSVDEICKEMNRYIPPTFFPDLRSELLSHQRYLLSGQKTYGLRS